MQVKAIAECSKGSILQYLQPSLSYYFPLRPLLCLFLSERLRQVLLYYMLISFAFKVDKTCHIYDVAHCLALALYLIETHFNTLANRADPD